MVYPSPPIRIVREKAVEDKEEVLLNSRQVAALLELSPDTVNELARKNVLPGVKRGRQWRFRRQDITLFKKQQQKQEAA